MLDKSTRAKYREIDRANLRPRTLRVPARARTERCAFLKCGNCEEFHVSWEWFDLLAGIEVRKCAVCGNERGFVRSGNWVDPVLRVHGVTMNPTEALTYLQSKLGNT